MGLGISRVAGCWTGGLTAGLYERPPDSHVQHPAPWPTEWGFEQPNPIDLTHPIPPNILHTHWEHETQVSLGCWIMLNPRMGWFDWKSGDVRGLAVVTWAVCRSLSDLSGPTNDLIYETWKNLKPWFFPSKIATVWMSVGSPIFENHHKTESYRLTVGLMVDRIIIIQLSIVSLSGKMKQRTYPGGTIDGKKYCHVIPIYWQAIFKSL